MLHVFGSLFPLKTFTVIVVGVGLHRSVAAGKLPNWGVILFLLKTCLRAAEGGQTLSGQNQAPVLLQQALAPYL